MSSLEDQFDLDLDLFNVDDLELQKLLDELSENTVSNFPLPYGLAPNFLINEEHYTIPMVCEESSVVAAASKSAKFWSSRGGFKTQILGQQKLGHVHFLFSGDVSKLEEIFILSKDQWFKEIAPLEINMKNRGGGVTSLKLLNHTDKMKDYYSLELKADTCNAMGANVINTILEKIAQLLDNTSEEITILMSILSNFTKDSLVKATVNCSLNQLDNAYPGMTGQQFAQKFVQAVEIARVNPLRAVTHNKGIMNGVDAVVLATGNDFRAIEACAHAYAAKDGEYTSLTKAWIHEDQFYFELEIPLALGTVGGLTTLHPLAKASLKILKEPSSNRLMEIVACAGLAQNFGAIKSLITSGIQKGHMKMHLLNILKSLGSNHDEELQCKKHFSDKVISVTNVREYLNHLRSLH
jgi:hydroxymethylglutaryl-CoA reductase